jgi:hypothetical protein
MKLAAVFAIAGGLSLLSATAVVAGAPARGYIDCRWNSGYVLRSRGHHEQGCFVVCPGCSCLTPTQYRSFAETALAGTTPSDVGVSWYLAGIGHREAGGCTGGANLEVLPPHMPATE